jgi:hypothetical protein
MATDTSNAIVEGAAAAATKHETDDTESHLQMTRDRVAVQK